jgi:GNAT superfamily N-acetyltransferase
MNTAKIRKAQIGDESSLAQVHIKSWQETYKGLIADEYLDSLTNDLDQRTQSWINTLQNGDRWTWVATVNNKIVGFALFGHPRDPQRENFIELGAIYLLNSEQGKGIGFALVKNGFEEMIKLGFKKAYCWVLEGNPTIQFYIRTGANFCHQIKKDQIGNKTYNELCYEWDSLRIGN